MPDLAPQRDAILTALERLLAWSEIARSPQLAKFLDYIVRRTLEGDEHSIKAYSIAVDVLGRASDFDPQADPIVRVQARRLRGLLDDYYRGPGAEETTRIGLPVGRYVPEFIIGDQAIPVIPAPPPEVASPRAEPQAVNITVTWFALAIITLGIATAAYAISTWGPRQQNAGVAMGAVQPPSVTVVEFQNLAGPAGDGPAVSGLAIELVTDLEQFENISIHYGGGGDGNISMTDLPASDYVLAGIVRPDGPLVQYGAILTDSRTGVVVWNYTVPIPAAEATDPGVLDEVSRLLSLTLGSPRGPLHGAARRVLEASIPPPDGFNLYLCRMLFDLYREADSTILAERTRACIAALSETEQQSAIGLAMLASLTVENLSATDTAATRADQFRIAEASLDRAISLSPISAFVWEQHARLREDMGEFMQARTDYGSSIQLNPANADALAAYARLLALGGNLAEAEAMALSAVEGTPNPPDWYHGVPALLALRDGHYGKAIEYAELYAQADRELGPVLAIIAAQRAGDGAVVNRYLPQVLDVPSFRARGVLITLRDRVQDNALMDQIRDSLVAAGVPPNALIHPF